MQPFLTYYGLPIRSGKLCLFKKEILIIIYSIINQNKMKMKTRTSKLFALAIVMLAFSASMFGQATATASATATATIVAPLTIANDVDMNFGNLAVSAGTGGTVVLATDDSRTRTDGVSLIAGGTVTAAQFTITGAGSTAYTITLPTTDYIITRAAGSVMEVNAFVGLPTAGAQTLPAGGTQVLEVGATLNVGAGETAGVYTNATGFDVTVSYN